MRDFQARIKRWTHITFGKRISEDTVERNHRFTEEALELVQACGGTREDCHTLVDYVFDRPVGEKEQEVGGVMVTLAALCNAWGIDVDSCAGREEERIWPMMEKIRAKQKAKPKIGPLPGVVNDT